MLTVLIRPPEERTSVDQTQNRVQQKTESKAKSGTEKKENIEENMAKHHQEKHDLGLYRVLQNPVSPEDGEIPYLDGRVENEPSKEMTSSDNHKETQRVVKESEALKQTLHTTSNKDNEQHNEKEVGIEDEVKPENKGNEMIAPLAADEELTTTSGGSSPVEQQIETELFKPEFELEAMATKLGDLTSEILKLEIEIEESSEVLETLEVEINKAHNKANEKKECQELIKNCLKEEQEWENMESAETEDGLHYQAKSDVDTAEKRKHVAGDDEKTITNSNAKENADSIKTEDDIFFSLTPSEVSEEDKTFSVELETKDVATEVLEDEIMRKVEENHSDLLLTCLVRLG